MGYDAMKAALPLASTAAAIYFTGGAAAPAVAGGDLAGVGATGAGAANGGVIGTEGLSLFGGEGASSVGAGYGNTAGLEGWTGVTSPLGVETALPSAAPGGAVGTGLPWQPAAGLTPIEGGFTTPALYGPRAPFDIDKGITRGFQGLLGGKILGDIMTLPPAAPFQMGSAQAPSPVVGGGGRFQPTAQGAMGALADQMAKRKANLGRIRFA